MRPIFEIKRTDFNPSNQRKRVITGDDGEPLFLQSFLGSWECNISDQKYLDRARKFFSKKLRLNGFTSDKINVGKNLIIYWEDSGSGSYQVIYI